MNLQVSKNNGRKYLSIVRGYRQTVTKLFKNSTKNDIITIAKRYRKEALLWDE